MLGGREVALELDEMPERGGDAGDRMSGMGGRERGVELLDAKRRERMAPAQREEVRHARHGGRKARLYALAVAPPPPQTRQRGQARLNSSLTPWDTLERDRHFPANYLKTTGTTSSMYVTSNENTALGISP